MMNLKNLQSEAKKYGDRAKAESEQAGAQIPNEYAFPFMKLVEEVGEVADVLEDRYGIRKQISEGEFRERMGEELSDVLMFLLHLANASGVNLEESLKDNFEKIEERAKHRR